MTGKTICWAHVGDLHLDEDDDRQGLGRLQTIVDQVNRASGGDFVFLPATTPIAAPRSGMAG